MIRTILRTLVEYLDPPRVIHDRSGVSPYLSGQVNMNGDRQLLREVAAGVQRAQQLAANAHRAARREA